MVYVGVKMSSRRGEKFLSFVERRAGLTTLLAASAPLLWPVQQQRKENHPVKLRCSVFNTVGLYEQTQADFMTERLLKSSRLQPS